MPNYTSNYNLYKPSRLDTTITVDDSLAGNFELIDEALLENSNKVKDIQYFVTPDMYFIAGSANYDLAFQQAIAECKTNNKILTGEYGKVYTVSQQILIDFPIRVDFNNATIKATTPMESIIKITNAVRIERLDMSNIVFDGNAKSTYGLYITNITDSRFQNIKATNSITAEIYVHKGTVASNQLTFNQIRCRRGTILAGTENCAVFLIEEADNHFNDIITVNYKTHYNHQSGVNWFHECHGWNSTTFDSYFADAVYMIVNSETVLTNCNCSEMGKAFLFTSNALLRINYCNFLLTRTVGGVVTTFFSVGAGVTNPSLRVSGTYLQGISPTLTQLCDIEPPAGNFIFDGSNNIPTSLTKVYKTFVDGQRKSFVSTGTGSSAGYAKVGEFTVTNTGHRQFVFDWLCSAGVNTSSGRVVGMVNISTMGASPTAGNVLISNTKFGATNDVSGTSFIIVETAVSGSSHTYAIYCSMTTFRTLVVNPVIEQNLTMYWTANNTAPVTSLPAGTQFVGADVNI